MDRDKKVKWTKNETNERPSFSPTILIVSANNCVALQKVECVCVCEREREREREKEGERNEGEK